MSTSFLPFLRQHDPCSALYGENNSPLIDRVSAKYVIVRSKTIIALLGVPVNKQRLSFLEFVIRARKGGRDYVRTEQIERGKGEEGAFAT